MKKVQFDGDEVKSFLLTWPDWGEKMFRAIGKSTLEEENELIWCKLSHHEDSKILFEYYKYSANLDCEEINLVLEQCNIQECSKSWMYDDLGISRLRSSIESAVAKKNLLIGLIGDSVACGAGSDVGGFGTGLEVYLTMFFKAKGVQVTVRNICNGGQTPQCNLYDLPSLFR